MIMRVFHKEITGGRRKQKSCGHGSEDQCILPIEDNGLRLMMRDRAIMPLKANAGSSAKNRDFRSTTQTGETSDLWRKAWNKFEQSLGGGLCGVHEERFGLSYACSMILCSSSQARR